jgi:hypothetical protein
MFIKHPVPRALAVSRQCHRLSSPWSSNPSICCRRTYAAATTSKSSSSSTPFTVSDIAGVRVAYRDDGGPTTGLSVVMRAGARYSPVPGISHLLEKFAWKVGFNNWSYSDCLEYTKENGVSSYKRDGITWRTFVIGYLSRDGQRICTMSPRRHTILP